MRNGQLPGKDQEAEKERLAVPGGILRRGATGRKNEQNFLKNKTNQTYVSLFCINSCLDIFMQFSRLLG